MFSKDAFELPPVVKIDGLNISSDNGLEWMIPLLKPILVKYSAWEAERLTEFEVGRRVRRRHTEKIKLSEGTVQKVDRESITILWDEPPKSEVRNYHELTIVG